MRGSSEKSWQPKSTHLPLFFSHSFFLLPIRDSTTTSKKWGFFCCFLFPFCLLLYSLYHSTTKWWREMWTIQLAIFVFVCYLRCGSASRASFGIRPRRLPRPRQQHLNYTRVVVSYVPDGLVYIKPCVIPLQPIDSHGLLSLSIVFALSARRPVTNSWPTAKPQQDRSQVRMIWKFIACFYHPS